MKHSTGKPTKAEQLRLDRIHAMPCRACIQQMMPQPLPTEAHHIVDKGYRSHSGGHMATLPLCGWHHRGEPLPHLYASDMRLSYGPSLALNKREFVGIYGSERDLLEQTNEELERRAA